MMNYEFNESIIRPRICPVCKGKKTVSAVFYDGLETTNNTGLEECRSCLGKGYIIC